MRTKCLGELWKVLLVDVPHLDLSNTHSFGPVCILAA